MSKKPFELESPVEEEAAIDVLLSWVSDYNQAFASKGVCRTSPRSQVIAEAVDELTAEINSLKQANKRLSDLGKAVEKERDEALKTAAQFETHADEVKADNERLEARLDEAAINGMKADEEMTALRGRVDSLEKTAAHAVQARNELETANAVQAERLKVMGNDLSEARKARDHFQIEHREQAMLVARLSGYIERIEDEAAPVEKPTPSRRESILSRLNHVVRPSPYPPGSDMLRGRW